MMKSWKEAMKSAGLDDIEIRCLHSIMVAWADFLMLDILHDDDVIEARHAVHAFQNIIMSRPVLRASNRYGEIKKSVG